MSPAALNHALDELARDLDLIVYRLEVEIPTDPEGAASQRQRVRADLERLRDRLEELVRRSGA